MASGMSAPSPAMIKPASAAVTPSRRLLLCRMKRTNEEKLVTSTGSGALTV